MMNVHMSEGHYFCNKCNKLLGFPKYDIYSTYHTVIEYTPHCYEEGKQVPIKPHRCKK